MSDTAEYGLTMFPPYGRIIDEWEDLIEGEGSAPPAWNSPVPWLEWRAKVIDLLNIVLWPRWDAENQRWVGAASTSMRELTKLDFRLLRDLRPMIKDNVSSLPETVTHYDLFKVEDVPDVRDGAIFLDRGPDASLRRYLNTVVDRRRLDDLAGGWILGSNAKSGNTDLELKRILQRPRAFQMAVILKIDWFTHQHATTAVTPAMISGHCFEAAMGGLSAFYRAQDLGCGSRVLDALAQHAIDVGDRRVFGGVHYPSDNISSWLVSLLIAPKVCRDDTAARWLWRAIGERSAVYKAIKAAVIAEPSCVYRKSFAVLNYLGDHPDADLDELIDHAGGTADP